jgi:hypothetical protein
VAISEPIRTEVLRTLRDKFRWSEERLADAGRLIGTAATSVAPRNQSFNGRLTNG